MPRPFPQIIRTPHYKIPKALNRGEEDFAFQCKLAGLHPIREYAFHIERGWRFDFFFEAKSLAVEIDGGVHRIKDRFERDLEKHNAAVLMGFTVLRYTPAMVKAGTAIAQVAEALR
jgi:very-short-patch-repair endonuclease